MPGALRSTSARVRRGVQRADSRRVIRRWHRGFSPPVTTRPPGERHRLCIGAVFQHEAVYLREWIEFHRLVGVEHFFLYDDRSDDDPRSVLEPYIDAGWVTYQALPQRLPRLVFDRQREVYNRCLREYGGDTEWLAFLDLDEFVYSCVPGEDHLPTVLQEHQGASAVAVNWIFFGTSGHILTPEGPVIANYVACRGVADESCKLIVAPARTIEMVSSHRGRFEAGAPPVDALGRPAADGYVTPPTVERLRINHYWTKSVEEWFGMKLRRGNVAALADRPGAEHLFAVERAWNDSSDTSIQRFLPELQRRLALPPASAGGG